jgi:hypothetical protein
MFIEAIGVPRFARGSVLENFPVTSVQYGGLCGIPGHSQIEREKY